MTQDQTPKKGGLLVPIVIIICIAIAVGLVGYYLASNALRSVQERQQNLSTPVPGVGNAWYGHSMPRNTFAGQGSTVIKGCPNLMNADNTSFFLFLDTFKLH